MKRQRTEHKKEIMGLALWPGAQGLKILTASKDGDVQMWDPTKWGSSGTIACGSDAPGHEQKCTSARHSFMDVVLIYLFCSIALGFLGGVRSLCFNLIGRHLRSDACTAHLPERPRVLLVKGHVS